MNIPYCHECAEASLLFSLKLHGIHNVGLQSDKKNSCFYIDAPWGKRYTLSVQNLTVSEGDSTIDSADYALFIKTIKHTIYNK